MTNYRNTAEYGTSGSTVTTGGSPSDGSTAWDTASIGSGATLIWDNTRALNGSLSYKFTTGASAVTDYLGWSTSVSMAVPMGVSAAYYFTAVPTAQVRILSLYQSGTLQAAINITSTGKLQLFAGSAVGTSTNTIPAGAWFRVELKIITSSATVGQAELRLFTDPYGTTPTETVTSAATINTLGGNPTEARFGIGTGQANVVAYWMDELQASNTGYPPAPVLPTQTVSPTGISTAETFGSTVVTTGAVTISPTGIASAEAFGAAQVNLGITGTGIASGEAWGIPTLSQGNAPQSVFPLSGVSAEAWGIPTVIPPIEPTYCFSPPSIRQGPADPQGERLWLYYKNDVGITVLKNYDGTYTQTQFPSQDDVAAAAAAYLGGHIYVVKQSEAFALNAAGYTTTRIS